MKFLKVQKKSDEHDPLPRENDLLIYGKPRKSPIPYPLLLPNTEGIFLAKMNLRSQPIKPIIRPPTKAEVKAAFEIVFKNEKRNDSNLGLP